jgi:hypothetical protein
MLVQDMATQIPKPISGSVRIGDNCKKKCSPGGVAEAIEGYIFSHLRGYFVRALGR